MRYANSVYQASPRGVGRGLGAGDEASMLLTSFPDSIVRGNEASMLHAWGLWTMHTMDVYGAMLVVLVWHIAFMA